MTPWGAKARSHIWYGITLFLESGETSGKRSNAYRYGVQLIIEAFLF
jgi:hypothetical protein